MLPTKSSGQCLRFAAWQKGRLFFCSIVHTVLLSPALAPKPAVPRPLAPPCAAPNRPGRGVSGFWIRQVLFKNFVQVVSRSFQYGFKIFTTVVPGYFKVIVSSCERLLQVVFKIIPISFQGYFNVTLMLSEYYLLVGSKTRTHHGPVGSGRRTAGRRGWAGLGRTGRRWVDPARRQPSLLLPGESKTLS